MGKQKKRWTLDEESALIAGVRKYGMGKWRDILSDQRISGYLKDRSNVDLKDKWRNLCANVGYLTLVAEPYYHLQMEDKWQNLGDNVGVLPPDAKPVPRVVATTGPKIRLWRIIMIITVIAIIGCAMQSHWKLLYLLPPIKLLWLEICQMTPAKLIKRWKDLRRSTRTACQYYKWLKKVAKNV